MEENAGRSHQYNIPGILHFIQHEWARFEMERSQWEVEKAELQARIAFLQVTQQGFLGGGTLGEPFCVPYLFGPDATVLSFFKCHSKLEFFIDILKL